ncbi:hypothetical protein [Streptomyces sp. SID3343]|uniref:hypothetical protein n=1 Tax=Streptomyces sp. SID3343 TaxID=2690260 RepID=UPI00136C938E|nr:hypothetical protein [Streptomyces sp. SID3343]MYV97480.1 hypothetical protein [Streptomyces sp. SID3343]
MVSWDDFYIFDQQAEQQRWHWNGAAWSKQAVNARSTLAAFKAFAPNDMWALGWTMSDWKAEAFHFDGVTWKPVPTPPGFSVQQVTGVSGRDLWVMGTATKTYDTVAYHWNGTVSKAATLPSSDNDNDSGGGASAAVTVSAKEIYAFGGPGRRRSGLR